MDKFSSEDVFQSVLFLIASFWLEHRQRDGVVCRSSRYRLHTQMHEQAGLYLVAAASLQQVRLRRFNVRAAALGFNAAQIRSTPTNESNSAQRTQDEFSPRQVKPSTAKILTGWDRRPYKYKPQWRSWGRRDKELSIISPAARQCSSHRIIILTAYVQSRGRVTHTHAATALWPTICPDCHRGDSDLILMDKK